MDGGILFDDEDNALLVDQPQLMSVVTAATTCSDLGQTLYSFL